jgi:hypothetical protein
LIIELGPLTRFIVMSNDVPNIVVVVHAVVVGQLKTHAAGVLQK